MSKKHPKTVKTLSMLVGTAFITSVLTPATVFAVEPTNQPALTEIPQSQMSAVWTNSPIATNEGANGALEKILDADPNSYWHTQWHPTISPLPHSFIIKLSEEKVKLAKLTLTPRQSSNGSGRAHDWEVAVTKDGSCTETSTFETIKTGSFPGEAAAYNLDRDILIKPATETNCVKFTQLSSWGGKNGSDEISPAETVGSLAEFKAYTGEWPSTPPSENPDETPDGTTSDNPAEIPADSLFTLSDGNLHVKMFKSFPQVYEWNLAAAKAPATTTAPTPLVMIDEQPKAVTVSAAEITPDQRSATWAIAVNDSEIRFNAKATVNNGVWKLELTDLVDPTAAVHRISLPTLNLVSLQPDEQLATATISVNRAISGDRFDPARRYTRPMGSYMSVPTTAQLSFGMDNNAIADNTQNYSGSNRGSNAKWVNAFENGKGMVIPGSFVWRSPSVSTIGLDPNPYVVVKPTVDANADNRLDWQDGAIALRSLRPAINGADQVKNTVITRIPFNIVSQATHPFLRTLDDTKRISLATDGLRQQVMLKGYQAEGHDSAHPDYAGHYNERAGGLKDLRILADESAKWNAALGVHVNVTESYSESKNFSEELLHMPPRKAWGWMNQSYYINGPKDLGTGKVLERFQQFKNEAPENLKWLYIDVYYPDGWEGQRLGHELTKQGWVLGTEWANKFPENSIWSHWANDENYGGSNNKGISSQIFRFVENSRRDIFNPHPILSNTNIVEFEGWTGHVNYNPFIQNVWDRNLPVKFLQQSDIMQWTDHRITFANGTVAESNVRSVNGRQVPYNRTITYDGATVYEGGSYLLPWNDGGSKRLYHWNIAGGTSTWTLTNAWKTQTSLEVFKLTDTGRERLNTLPVNNGQITLTAEPGVAYVLYPTSEVPAAKTPNWGQGSNINDPSFFSGNLNAYQVTGEANIVQTERGNFQAQLGAGKASLTQALAAGNLPAGTYNASAWIEIPHGQKRTVTLSVNGDGVKPTKLQNTVNGVPTTTVNTTLTINRTASDEKLDTYFQRARVTFTTTGGKVNFTISADTGTALVNIDDLRLVSYTEPTLPTDVDPAKVVLFENYEHPDSGYWPYVTGPDQRGDARTQLTERHAPYSQAGWWGVNSAGVPQQGYKLVDNVLDGNWSIMAHEENSGLILRTSETTVQFKPNHQYRISFDYQNALADTYAFVTGYDYAGADGQSILSRSEAVHNFTSTADTSSLPARGVTKKFTHVLNVGTCGSYFFGIQKIGGGHQADLSMDNILVEDLGVSEQPPACAQIETTVPSGSLVAGKPTVVNTVIHSAEKTAATAVKHSLNVPADWSVIALEAADSAMPAGGTSTQRWLVSAPAAAAGTSAFVEAAGSYQLEGTAGAANSGRVVSARSSVRVTADGLVNGKNYLSDLPFVSEVNGWGPVERDTNNGENQAGDGGPIRIDGTAYEKGLGTHADSAVRIKLGGKCKSFHAVVGVDDRQTSAGSVQFKVLGDNREVVPLTEVLRARSAALTLSGDITGVDELVLQATNAGDGNGNDWASWGDAHVICEVSAAEAPATLVASADRVKPGESVTLTLGGFTHGAPAVSIRDALTAQQLGTVTVSEDGAGTFKYTVPADFKAISLTFGAVQTVADSWKAAVVTVQVTQPEGEKPDSAVNSDDNGNADNNENTDNSSDAASGDSAVPAAPQVTLIAPSVTAGEEAVISGTGTGFTPNGEVVAELHSKPVLLGRVNADAAGKLTFSFKLPTHVPAGLHHVVLRDVPSGKVAKAELVIKAAKPQDQGTGVNPTEKPQVINPKAPEKTSETGNTPKSGKTPETEKTTETGKTVANGKTKALSNTGVSLTGISTVVLLLGAAGLTLTRRRRHS